MNYWLLKTEPDTYSWDNLVKDKTGVWDGVRNFQARKHIKEMKKGDLAFFYHTGDEKSIIGIASIVKESYPDPKDKEWAAVDITPKQKLKNPVALAQIKADKRLSDMVLVRVARLSVQPVRKEEFDIIMTLSEGK
ncbi:MAG TPA: EVE domain-containing protein [Cyclobacteriaceae bacterium]|nr:EVE domain-containing protein [Cyclobacteriaceae bacterium]